ncbi:SAM-dependent methyltransferase [Sporomusa sp. KB1]|jgi:methyltransferase (TIGR00027 family)|uniref:class I SAM-dependent methyltransferase n=1 Tax=Sporomusa sp. KB1 TaxID=943346 RepID=UPI0011A944CB|nr:SAM-dependent methyltransferase [Sporomusa sp. KB1]TWH46784.1 methyltransferase (TIGR00027 family) [Sporomusa sp. KB1]
MSNRDIKVSKTGQGTCLMRATSYYEQDPCYKSDDYIASLFLPLFLTMMLKYNFLRTILKKSLFKVPGIYEYVISRTKFIDEIVKNFDENIEQVLIFGAGFDSRTIRFKNELRNANVFELDAPATQQAKLKIVMEKKIEIPANVTFVSLDFTKECILEKLEEAGFQKNRRCLFLLEGLTYYLNHEAIDSIFNLMSAYSEKNSLLIFDYAIGSAGKEEQFCADSKTKKQYQALIKAGERPGFMIDGSIQDFLVNYKFDLIQELTSNQLANIYFNKEGFELAAQNFKIVKAIKK